MLEAESLLRAGRVKVYAGDLAGWEADVIAGEPIATVWLAALRKFSRRAELRLTLDTLGAFYLNQGPQRHPEQRRFLTLACRPRHRARTAGIAPFRHFGHSRGRSRTGAKGGQRTFALCAAIFTTLAEQFQVA
jgi:hypothetical protein